MSRVPSTTNPRGMGRIRVPTPSAEGGGIGQVSGQALSQAGQTLARITEQIQQAQNAAELTEFEGRAFQQSLDAMDAAREAEPGRMGDVFRDRLGSLRENVEQTSDPQLRQAKQQALQRVEQRFGLQVRREARGRITDSAQVAIQELSQGVLNTASQPLPDRTFNELLAQATESIRRNGTALSDDQITRAASQTRQSMIDRQFQARLDQGDFAGARTLIESNRGVFSSDQIQDYQRDIQSAQRVADQQQSILDDQNTAVMRSRFERNAVQSLSSRGRLPADFLDQAAEVADMSGASVGKVAGEFIADRMEAIAANPSLNDVQRFEHLQSRLPDSLPSEVEKTVRTAQRQFQTRIDDQRQLASRASSIVASGEFDRVDTQNLASEVDQQLIASNHDLMDRTRIFSQRETVVPETLQSDLNRQLDPGSGQVDSGVRALHLMAAINPDRARSVASGLEDSDFAEAAVHHLKTVPLGTRDAEQVYGLLASPDARQAMSAASRFLPGGDEEVDVDDALGEAGMPLQADLGNGRIRGDFNRQFRFELARISAERGLTTEMLSDAEEDSNFIQSAARRAARTVSQQYAPIHEDISPIPVDVIGDLNKEQRMALAQAILQNMPTDVDVSSIPFSLGEGGFAADPQFAERVDDRVLVPGIGVNQVESILEYDVEADEVRVFDRGEDGFDERRDRIMDGRTIPASETTPLLWRPEYGSKAPGQTSRQVGEAMVRRAVDTFVTINGEPPDPSDNQDVRELQQIHGRIAESFGWKNTSIANPEGER